MKPIEWGQDSVTRLWVEHGGSDGVWLGYKMHHCFILAGSLILFALGKTLKQPCGEAQLAKNWSVQPGALRVSLRRESSNSTGPLADWMQLEMSVVGGLLSGIFARIPSVNHREDYYNVGTKLCHFLWQKHLLSYWETSFGLLPSFSRDRTRRPTTKLPCSLSCPSQTDVVWLTKL